GGLLIPGYGLYICEKHNAMTLLERLQTVSDPRRAQGQRYPLNILLILMLMGTMAGRVGYRSIARFCQQFEKELKQIFDLPHGVPSHVTLSKTIGLVDVHEFTTVLNEWSKGQVPDYKGVAIAFDGKAVKSSVSDPTSKTQNFIAFVNAYCHERELVIGSLSFENKHGSEIEAFRELANALELEGAVFTLDAKHDSKKL
ncbi:MAG: ISAs1 family transposase, partial [Bacteroidota bacterium]